MWFIIISVLLRLNCANKNIRMKYVFRFGFDKTQTYNIYLVPYMARRIMHLQI